MQENASHDNLLGTFDTTTTHQQFGQLLMTYQTTSNIVSDSTGTGLPDGTTWDSGGLNLQAGFPLYGFELFNFQSLDVPDGMNVDFFQFLGIGNEVVTSGAGTSDFRYLWGDFIPLFDIPT